ncbi:MAG: winged helix-turn-helix domain-containing protein [Candidatus Parcubacteria bacterium]|nr:winged helix-turn-helix domain-containing protein [Burkholderiales bacterium]
MPTIRVDHDVFEGLQKLARPFVDSPSAVIRRMLEAQGILEKPPSAQARPARLAAHALTPQSVYEKYLLYILAREFRGKGHKRDVTHAVVKRMMKDGHIGAADQELVKTGETKAENTIVWARNAYKDRGLISRASARGFWELTEEGMNAADRLALPKPVTST